eukprot:g18047.t1
MLTSLQEYVVKLRMLDASCSFKCPGHEELSRLREGIDLGDGKDLAVALSAELLRCDADERSALLRLVVSNGRYHLVRRMCSALGASEPAEDLQPGEYAPLSPEEVKAVYLLLLLQRRTPVSPRGDGRMPRRPKFASLGRRRELSEVLCAITSRKSALPREPQEFSRVLHTFGTDTANWEERQCVSRDAVRDPFTSPFKHQGRNPEEELGINLQNREPIVGRKLTNNEALARARRVIISAKALRASRVRARSGFTACAAHREMTWDKVFAAADVDRSGSLDVKELKQAVRSSLRISPQTHLLFEAIDHDNSGLVELTELLQYVSHGAKRDDQQELFRKKTARVRRTMNLAFRKYTASHSAITELFANIDAGGDGKISLAEFMYFARMNLKLSAYDVGDMELKQFYKGMDPDGDGVDPKERHSCDS